MTLPAVRVAPEGEGTIVDIGSGFTDAQRDRLRQRTAEERARAEHRAVVLARDLDDIIASSDTANVDDEHDPEGSTIAFERAQITELLRVARLEVRELDAAADRLASGVYGWCERCGEPIPIERLLARPASRRCVRCVRCVDG